MPVDPIDDAVLFEMLADNRELVAQTWHFFLSVHMAILAVLYIGQRRTFALERGVLLAAYAGFMAFNYFGQATNYAAYELIVARIRAMGPEASALLPGDGDLWLLGPGIHGVPLLACIYATAGVLSALVIMFINRRGNDETDRYSYGR